MSSTPERIPQFGVARTCTKCKGDMLKQRGCMRCDSRGYIADCDACEATGLIKAPGEAYGVKECKECGGSGYRPANFAELPQPVIENKFCMKCGRTGAHKVIAGGTLCRHCEQTNRK